MESLSIEPFDPHDLGIEDERIQCDERDEHDVGLEESVQTSDRVRSKRKGKRSKRKGEARPKSAHMRWDSLLDLNLIADQDYGDFGSITADSIAKIICSFRSFHFPLSTFQCADFCVLQRICQFAMSLRSVPPANRSIRSCSRFMAEACCRVRAVSNFRRADSNCRDGIDAKRLYSANRERTHSSTQYAQSSQTTNTGERVLSLAVAEFSKCRKDCFMFSSRF
jgi:hypothetical protein